MTEPLGSVGGWILDEKIGEGGMGAVFRARHPANPGRPVALKVLTAARREARAVARFEREARALAALNDPNVVRIFAAGQDAGRPYYVMELVAGRSLGALVKESGPLPPQRAARLLATVALAVGRIHAKGVLHRDLKPENVLLDAEERPRVCDFGLAWLDDTAERLTRTGALLGTPAFAAPEQLTGGAKEADERADIYALGATLFFALTGRPPFEAETAVALLARVAEDPAPAPSSLRPGVSRQLDAICLRALEKEPSRRYANARALGDDLERVLRGDAPYARPPSRLEELGRVSWRLRAPLVALAVCAAVVVAALVVVRRVSPPRGEDAPTREALAVAKAKQAARELGDRLAALGPSPSLAELSAAGEAAIAAPSSACLVGELPGVALGDLLLDAERPELAALAGRLAAARLTAVPDDAAGRALRAYATLAKLGAPRRALGPGGLDAAVPEETLRDLVAARSLPGGAGERAAWLLVDLLALAGPARGPEARAAFESARTLAGPDASPPASVGLERLVAATPTARTLADELGALRAEPSRAALAARFFARAGAPSALEHASLAAAGAPLDRVLGAETVARFLPVAAPVSPRDVKPPLARGRDLLDECQLTEAERYSGSRDALAVVAARVEARRGPIVAQLGRALELAPRDPSVLSACSDVLLGSLSGGVFAVLGSRTDLDRHLAEAFTQADRRASRGGFAARPFSERWEAARAEELDARLAEDVQRDELVAILVRAGMPARDVKLAVEAVEGLWRVDALAEGLPAEERDLCAAEAFVRLESLARLGGPMVLPFRARLRKLALPAPIGPWLARLDLERAARVARAVEDPSRDVSTFALLAANVAAEAPADEALVRTLYRLGVVWAHEAAVHRKALADPGDRRSLAFHLANRGTDVKHTRAYLSALRARIPEAVIEKDFAPTAEDEARLTKPYAFRGAERSGER